MKVYELIDLLKRYPSQADVVITWESTVNDIEDHLVYISKKDCFGTTSGTVILDADGNSYKDNFGGQSL